jgi:hypothetical protein
LDKHFTEKFDLLLKTLNFKFLNKQTKTLNLNKLLKIQSWRGGGVINGRLIGTYFKKFKNLKTYIVLDLTLYAWKSSISLL